MAKKYSYIFCILFLFLISSCGSDMSSQSTEKGSITFKLSLEDNTTKPNGDSQFPSMAPVDCTANGISTVSATVYDSQGNVKTTGGPWDCSAHSGTVNDISSGGVYRFLIIAKDSSGTIKYSGEKSDIAINSNQTTDVGTLTLLKAYYVTTIAGVAGSSGASDGTGTTAMFNSSSAITTDGTNLFVADTNSHTIRKIVISTGAVTTIAGTAGSYGSTNGTGTAARFYWPKGITTDGTNLFVVSSSNGGDCSIRKIVISTGVVTTLAGGSCGGGTDGTGTSATFSSPYDITTDGTNLFVVDRDNHTIRKIVISTGVVTTFAGSIGFSGSADGTGTSARFKYPEAITTDGTNLYVIDTNNEYIRKIVISTGVVTSIVKVGYLMYSRITTDGTNLFITNDNNNGTIERIVISTGDITRIAGSPPPGYSTGSTDGIGWDARFSRPSGMTMNGTDIYLTDTDNHTIRKLY